MTLQLGTELITLRRARLDNGLTMTQLSKKSGIAMPIISRIENGGGSCQTQYPVAYKLAETLDVPINRIYWPNGLTHRGRPFGCKNGQSTSADTGSHQSTCPTCYTTLPVCGHCDFCD